MQQPSITNAVASCVTSGETEDDEKRVNSVVDGGGGRLQIEIELRGRADRTLDRPGRSPTKITAHLYEGWYSANQPSQIGWSYH